MITGKFIEECSNRFLCHVSILGDETECYVSSSSKLENYIDLKNKTVMLVENKGKNLRTQYTLQAGRIKGKWVLLNLNSINELYLEMLSKERKYKPAEIQREKFVQDYKTDFYIEKEKLLIEAKGILSENPSAIYPVVSCGRAYRQLLSIQELLKQGYSVEYGFVLMNPGIKRIELNTKEDHIREAFKCCIDLGMQVSFYSTRWYKGKCSIKMVSSEEIELTC